MDCKDTTIRIFSFAGVLFTLVSLFISVSALVRDSWITGTYYVQSYYQWQWCSVQLGFFGSCNTCTGCGGTFSWIPGAISSEIYSQWTTLQAFFIMHLIFATMSFTLMQSTAVKPGWITFLKFAGPISHVLNFVTGLIALTLSTTQVNRLSYMGSWNSDISTYLQIGSFSVATAGLLFHTIGRCIKARQAKAENSSMDAPLLGSGIVLSSFQGQQPQEVVQDIQAQQPQQIAVVVNGQTVMATINPSRAATPTPATPSGDAYTPMFSHPQPLLASWSQPVFSTPLVYYPNQAAAQGL